MMKSVEIRVVRDGRDAPMPMMLLAYPAAAFLGQLHQPTHVIDLDTTHHQRTTPSHSCIKDDRDFQRDSIEIR